MVGQGRLDRFGSGCRHEHRRGRRSDAGYVSGGLVLAMWQRRLLRSAEPEEGALNNCVGDMTQDGWGEGFEVSLSSGRRLLRSAAIPTQHETWSSSRRRAGIQFARRPSYLFRPATRARVCKGGAACIGTRSCRHDGDG